MSEDDTVFALKRLAWDLAPDEFGDIDARKLQVFKVCLSKWKKLGNDGFRRVVENAVTDVEPLWATSRIGKFFPLEGFKQGNLHIVVQSPIDARRASTGGTYGDPGIFGAGEVQAILEEMQYEIKFVLLGHPFVAMVSDVIDKSKIGFLKFIRRGRKEIPILQYLSTIDSPRNHTVTGLRFWPVPGGHVTSAPSAGSWITYLTDPNAHMWSVAEQLFEAVDFMHQHGVAHLDLKPANVLIPVGGGRLSIIDFDGSVRIDGVGTMFSGVVGTPGYIPPEVAADRDPFSALRADLWSCGKTLAEFCDLCGPSADRDALLQICGALMDEDPEKRPMMSEALQRMADHKPSKALEHTC